MKYYKNIYLYNIKSLTSE